jgi:uncharacterized low-complexity protein
MISSKKILLAAAMTTLASTSYLASADYAYAGEKSKTEKGEHEKCADGSCGDKSKTEKGEHEKCADGSCGDKSKKAKGEHEKCADGSCGDKGEDE